MTPPPTQLLRRAADMLECNGPLAGREGREIEVTATALRRLADAFEKPTHPMVERAWNDFTAAMDGNADERAGAMKRAIIVAIAAASVEA